MFENLLNKYKTGPINLHRRKEMRAYRAPRGRKRLTSAVFFGDNGQMEHELYGVHQTHGGISLDALRAGYIMSSECGNIELAKRAVALAKARYSPTTLKSYDATMNSIAHWCSRHGVEALPMRPQVAQLLVTALAEDGYSTGSINRFMTVLRQAHKYAELPDPTAHPMVKATLRGAQRVFGRTQEGKAPFCAEDIQKIAELARVQPNGVRAVRDLAIITVGFVSAMRRAELVAMKWSDLQWSSAGDVLTISIPRSKTDQRGAGQQVGLHRTGRTTCPVTALDRWAQFVPEKTGHVFRTVSRLGQIGSGAMTACTIARVVQGYAQRLNYDPGAYGAHSLRAGFVSDALQSADVRDIDVMRQLRHTHIESTLRYYRPKTQVNLTQALGL